MAEFVKICTRCGVKQKRDGECWDYNECSKCFVSMSTKDIAAAQETVPVLVAPTMYILGPETDKMATVLDQVLQEAHLATPEEIEKANQNMEWVVS